MPAMLPPLMSQGLQVQEAQLQWWKPTAHKDLAACLKLHANSPF